MAKVKTSSLEKISIALTGVLLLSLAVYGVHYTRTHTHIRTAPEYTADLPATGKLVTISSISTAWKKQGKEILPTATITLDSSKSSSGDLRIFFRSNIGECSEPSELVGDSSTLRIRNGLFENGKNTLEVQGTQGFTNLADFLSYQAQEDFRWIIELHEGTENNFSRLAQAPIEPVLLEK